MRVAVFSARTYERAFFDAANEETGHELVFHEAHLNPDTVALADGSQAVCVFVNDVVDAGVIARLGDMGVGLIALRCAGFNNVDLTAAANAGLSVARVPDYSPFAVAEHTVALMLGLNRHLHRAYNRVREGNFDLGGLLGFDMNGKTVGIVGTGKIGARVAKICHGFGCTLLAYDVQTNPMCERLRVTYCSREDLFENADIITLHCPLTPDTRHMIDEAAVARMKHGAMLINTSRGAIIDTRAVISGLKTGRIGALGLDVYEEEADLFFENLSNQIIRDDVFARLLTFPNVIITGHQAFFTHEAMTAIAKTTVGNLAAFERSGGVLHAVTPDMVAG